MKTMTCRQLGGACDERFTAATFEEIARMSKRHGSDMFRRGDAAHLQAMERMKRLMEETDAMRRWFADRKAEFEALPEDRP